MDKTATPPVFTHPLGLALGADPAADLGLHLNAPSTDRLLERIGRNTGEGWAKAAN
jgi:hypothetical protein